MSDLFPEGMLEAMSRPLTPEEVAAPALGTGFVVDPEPQAYQPPFPGFGPPVCARHEFKGRGRWRPCVRCWTAGWFPTRRR